MSPKKPPVKRRAFIVHCGQNQILQTLKLTDTITVLSVSKKAFRCNIFIQRDRLMLCSLLYHTGDELFKLGLNGVQVLLPNYLMAIDIVYTESLKLRSVNFRNSYLMAEWLYYGFGPSFSSWVKFHSVWNILTSQLKTNIRYIGYVNGTGMVYGKLTAINVTVHGKNRYLNGTG